MTLDAATYCFGGAALFYLWSWNSKRQAQTLTNAVRVKELQELGELIGNNNTSGLLVAVSGKVGSNAAFMCKRSGVLAVSLTEKTCFSTENEAGYLKMDSEEILLSHKTVPWFLEANTGQVNVVGFYRTFKRNVFAEPVNKLFQKVLHRKGVEIVRHTCSEDVLEIGTPLRIVAEAFRDRDGAPTIKAPPSQVFNGYISLDKVASNLESESECFRHLSFLLATIGVYLLTVRRTYYKFC